MAQNDNILEIRDLSVAYGKKNPTVHHVNLEIHKGSVVSLIGPNACGKSTVIKAISRLIPYENGSITLDGKPLEEYRRRELAQKTAVLLQNNAIPPSLTVKELVTYGRTPYINMLSRTNSRDEEIINWAIDRAGVRHLIHRSVGNLSGGERQKVLFAMAVARQPKLLILDEPTTFLDVCHQMEILNLAKQLNEDMGTSVLMVLHDLNQAAFYSDYIYMMKEGRMIHEGTPAGVLTEAIIRKDYLVEAEISHGEWPEKPFVKILGLAERGKTL